MRKIFLIILLRYLLPTLLLGQMDRDTSFHKIEEMFMAQRKIYPQEKIHLHTDRDFYVPGEKIWFKAYVTDAVTHQYPTPSRYVYAELIDSRDSLINRVMIRSANNMFYGYLFLSEVIPEGNYTLRAYTRYMENLGNDYFFNKNILIGNMPSDKEHLSEAKWKKQKKKALQDDFDVSFFPEGGNLLKGIFCKVAFKALNCNGYPETVSGELIDEAGSVVASAKTLHAGMGMFNFNPEEGKKYYFKCRNENGLEKQFELPQPNSRAYSLTASRINKRLMIGIQKSVDSPDIPCYLLVHSRGIPFYFSAWDKEKEGAMFVEKQFPAGVVQFVLFDEQMNPLSERLVFCKNNDDVKAEFHTDKALYETRENIICSLSLTDSAGYPLDGNLSAAITDDKDVAVDSSTTILSSLLLSSELKGYIENPAWYLQDNSLSATALDYLMMTHGWRRYNIPEVVKGNPEYPRIPYQTSYQISGEVKSLIFPKPVANSEILMLIKGGNFGTTTTDEKGRFIFRDFEYPDSTFFFIQALGKKGSKRVELVLNKESFPKLSYAPQSPAVEITQIGKKTKDEAGFIAKAEQRSKYDNDMRVVHLGEVVITAQKTEKKDEARLRFYANSGSDATIRREDFENSPPTRVSDLLYRVAGVRVFSNGAISIRDGGGGGLPLVLIDGMPIEWPDQLNSPYESPLETVNVNDVESIDVFKGPSAAIFGMRGANGAISITTRRGGGSSGIERFNYATYTPLGYQKPVEFYAPRYETLEAKRSDIPDYRTTIFWKPDIVISNDGKANFEFYASDFPTSYSVVLEGLTTDGRIIRRIEKIQVK